MFALKRICVLTVAALLYACSSSQDAQMPVAEVPPDPAPVMDGNPISVLASVQASDGQALAAYDVALAGPSELTVGTDQEGAFTASLIPGAYRINVSVNGEAAGTFDRNLTESGDFEDLVGNTFVVEIPEDAIGIDLRSGALEGPLTVIPDRPSPAETVTLKVQLSPEQSILDFQAQGPGCGDLPALALTDTGGSAAVGAAGPCVLSITVDTPQGPQVSTTQFSIQPGLIALSGLSVEGAVFDPTAVLAQPTSDIQIASLTVPGALLNGGTLGAQLALANPMDVGRIAEVAISVEGFPGVYFMPVTTNDAGQIVIPLQLAEDFFEGSPLAFASAERSPAPSSTGGEKGGHKRFEPLARSPVRTQETTPRVNAQVVDDAGRFSNIVQDFVDTLIVPKADLQVSVSWDSATDVDIHVVEPTGEEIYFGNIVSDAGGFLDLDSNPGCDIDGINNENVGYLLSETIPEGEYIVRVTFFDDCSTEDMPGFSASYTVTVNNCNDTDTFTGFFAAGSSTGGGLGSGVEVARFEFEQCGDYRVRGIAVYEDLRPSSEGLDDTPRDMPIRNAVVSVIDENDETLAVGSTDDEGRFDLTFANPDALDWTVDVITETDQGPLQSVVDEDGLLYALVSDPFTADDRDVTDVELRAGATESGPAFNILDVGVEGMRMIERFFRASPLGELTWLYPAPQTGYTDSTTTISVMGGLANDGQDDSVLAHEFGHFTMDKLSVDDSPGGGHSIDERIGPAFAFSEGMAHFIGQTIVDSPLQINTMGLRVEWIFDIEGSMDYPLGTLAPSGTGETITTAQLMAGLLSEAVVATTAWDLADDTPNEEFFVLPEFLGTELAALLGYAPQDSARDTVANQRAVFRALIALLENPTRRGAPGADLVDLLDRWRCAGGGDDGPGTPFSEVISGVNTFPYDYNSPLGEADCAQ